jgi:hypothetical protein
MNNESYYNKQRKLEDYLYKQRLTIRNILLDKPKDINYELFREYPYLLKILIESLEVLEYHISYLFE